MSTSPLPSVNYLWISPIGTAYTGIHHQLILHLLARESNWLEQEVDINKIKAHLGMSYPQYLMDDMSLEAIGAEYLGLNRILRTAYRLAEPTVKVCRPSHNDPTSYEAVAKNPDVQDLLDPALFEQSEPFSSKRPSLSSSPPPFSDSTAGTIYSDEELHELAHQIRAVKKSTQQSVTRLLPSISNRSRGSSRVTKKRTKPVIFRPKTPTKSIQSVTPSRPTCDRFIDLVGLSSSLSANRSDSRLDKIPTQTGSIVKDIGRILFYAQNVHKARKQNLSFTDMPSIRPVLEIVDGNTIDTSEMRLPDPTKYIQTSRNHYTIPASEAEAFCHVSCVYDLLGVLQNTSSPFYVPNRSSVSNFNSGSNQLSILFLTRSKATYGTATPVTNLSTKLFPTAKVDSTTSDQYRNITNQFIERHGNQLYQSQIGHLRLLRRQRLEPP